MGKIAKLIIFNQFYWQNVTNLLKKADLFQNRFFAFCDQVEIFKLLIFILIYKCFRITAIMLNGADYSH
jgi:hypothetical protein